LGDACDQFPMANLRRFCLASLVAQSCGKPNDRPSIWGLFKIVYTTHLWSFYLTHFNGVHFCLLLGLDNMYSIIKLLVTSPSPLRRSRWFASTRAMCKPCAVLMRPWEGLVWKLMGKPGETSKKSNDYAWSSSFSPLTIFGYCQFSPTRIWRMHQHCQNDWINAMLKTFQPFRSTTWRANIGYSLRVFILPDSTEVPRCQQDSIDFSRIW